MDSQTAHRNAYHQCVNHYTRCNISTIDVNDDNIPDHFSEENDNDKDDGTVWDGLTDKSHGSKQQQASRISLVLLKTGMANYGVVWDISHDHTRVSTTSCAPHEQSNILIMP
jgi:hypothetical protein